MYCICDFICLRYSLKYATFYDFVSWLIYKKVCIHMLPPVHSNGTSPYHKLNIPHASLAPEWRAAWCAAVPAPDPRLNVTRQGVGCLACKLYDLILRCFTTRLQFFCIYFSWKMMCSKWSMSCRKVVSSLFCAPKHQHQHYPAEIPPAAARDLTLPCVRWES